ncbi:calcium/sodium antiporter [Aminirod propionatiphilus]
MMIWMKIVAGLALLYGGGEVLVGGSTSLARRLGLSPLVVSLTVVAFGTSAPELAAALSATLRGSGDLVMGNVLGSNVANVGLILGLAVLLRPIAVDRRAFRRDLPLLVLTSLILVALLSFGEITPLIGLLLLALLGTYTLFTLKGTEPVAVDATTRPGLLPALAAVAGAVALLALGADLLVDGAVTLARHLGVGEHLIGLTVVALGTSLPELSSCLVAARRGDSDFILGNLLGSNIFNVLAILGVSAQLGPLKLSWNLFGPEGLGLVALSLLLVLFSFTGFRLARREGACLLACYGGYLALLAA